MCDHLGHDAGVPAADKLPDATQRLRRAEQPLRQGEARHEVHVLWDDHLEPTRRILHPAELHDLRVVVQDVLVQELRRHEDHVPLGVQEPEDATDLCRLDRLVAFHAGPACLRHCERADMHLYAAHLLRLEPVLAHFVHEPGVELPILVLDALQLHFRHHPGQRSCPRRLDMTGSPVSNQHLSVLTPLLHPAPLRGNVCGSRRADGFLAGPCRLNCGKGYLVGICVRPRIEELCAEGAIALGYASAAGHIGGRCRQGLHRRRRQRGWCLDRWQLPR
mmetsp:Transcript_130553/g.279070  ORF Transcript_130553/g.279070 Transcript_130553/m.279070 type:complete len:276 (-) Transcript_130553:839-1666(-)